MREPLAIRLQDVSKVYKLHGSQRDQLIYVLGLQRIGFRMRHPAKEYVALSGISLDVPRGHRIGIVGRNGAGKTTLLKLICGNFAPTSGMVDVNGTVQALMGMGLGFHPEYTGRENVEASLQYNGLARHEYRAAMEDIIEFCELGDFLDQPFKTYSLGMQARLMFAAATAIRPDILIVDEVLGAGDAYFVAKSKLRVEKLVRSGCTMLLVSHSMQQVLELCTEAIWLDQGRIRMRGEAFLVVKAYEEYLHGPIQRISLPTVDLTGGMDSEVAVSRTAAVAETDHVSACREESAPERAVATCAAASRTRAVAFLQEPYFQPHRDLPQLPEVSNEAATEMRFEAPGGISRWQSEPGLKICGFSVASERGIGNTLVALRPAKFVIFVVAEIDHEFDCRYGIAIHDLMGRCVTRIFGHRDRFRARCGELRRVEITLNPNQIGPGEYTVGISILGYTPLEQLNSAKRYDLVSRSFAIRVELPESLGATAGFFYHSAEWSFSKV